MPTQTSSLAFQAQVNALGDRIEKRFDAQADTLSGIENRLRSLETKEAGCQPIITSRMDAAWRRLENHDKEIAELTKLVNTQATSISKMEEARKDFEKDSKERDKERDEEFKTLTKLVGQQTVTISQLYGVAKWLLGILTAVLVAIFIGLATGQLQIVVK